MSPQVALHAPPPPAAQRWPLRAFTLVLLALLAVVLRPVLGAVIAGGFAVIVAQRPFRWLVRRVGGRRKLASALATAALVALVLIPLSFAAISAAGQATDAARRLRAELASGAGQAVLEKLPPVLREALPQLLDGARAAFLDSAARVAPLIPRAAASAGHAVVNVVLSVVSVFYLFLQGPALVGFVMRVSPLQRQHTLALVREVRAVAMGLFRGGVLVALYHGASAALGFALFGVPHVLLLTLLTAAASLVPLVGTGLVLVPVVAGLALAGDLGRAVGLGIWSLLVVGAGDHLFRPLWSKGEMVMPRLMLFLTIFGGLQIFGPIGILLGPLLGSLTVVALGLIAERR